MTSMTWSSLSLLPRTSVVASQADRFSYMVRQKALFVACLLALLAIPAQADTLCFSPVKKKTGDIASDRPWWKPFNYRVQVDDGQIIKPATDSSTSYDFDTSSPLVRIFLGKEAVESFQVPEDHLSAGRNCIYFNNLYETWSIAELWQVEKLCSCEIKEIQSSCPDWTAADETCPVVGSYGDVWREFYFEGTSEAHLVGILVSAGPKMVPSIIEAIEDRKMYARRYAISALGLLKQPRAISALTGIANDETETDYFRSDALQAIYVIDAETGQKTASELLNDPDLPDGLIKQAAIEVLEHPERIPQVWKRH